MFGRKPRLTIAATLGLVGTNPQESNYSDYMERLRERVDKAYQIANEAAKSSQAKQKLYYDKKQRGAVVRPDDRVLVKIVAFDGKHKISDRWEPDVYVVKDKPNLEVPVYILGKENGEGPERTLHRNLLLPIGSLPLDSSSSAEGRHDSDADVGDNHPPNEVPAANTGNNDDDDDGDDDDESSLHLALSTDDDDFDDVYAVVEEDVQNDQENPVVHTNPDETTEPVIADRPAQAAEPGEAEARVEANPTIDVMPRRSIRAKKKSEWMTHGKDVAIPVDLLICYRI